MICCAKNNQLSSETHAVHFSDFWKQTENENENENKLETRSRSCSFVFLFLQFFPDVAWERNILSLRVKCKMSKRGCDWTGQLRHFQVMWKEDYAFFPRCIAPQCSIELVCDVITFKMDARNKQLHQAPVFGEDTDVIYLHSCDLNTKIDLTEPSLKFLRLNVVFG